MLKLNIKVFRHGELAEAKPTVFISSKKDIASLVSFLDNTNFEGLKGHKLQQYKEWKEK